MALNSIQTAEESKQQKTLHKLTINRFNMSNRSTWVDEQYKQEKCALWILSLSCGCRCLTKGWTFLEFPRI